MSGTVKDNLIAACPNCKTDEHIAVYEYGAGNHHVECVKCNYLGPGQNSKRAAIKSHNARAISESQ